jgi:hypothetical protein
MIHSQLFGDQKVGVPVPVIIFGGFCNWSVFFGVLGFWDDEAITTTTVPCFVHCWVWR